MSWTGDTDPARKPGQSNVWPTVKSLDTSASSPSYSPPLRMTVRTPRVYGERVTCRQVRARRLVGATVWFCVSSPQRRRDHGELESEGVDRGAQGSGVKRSSAHP